MHFEMIIRWAVANTTSSMLINEINSFLLSFQWFDDHVRELWNSFIKNY